MLRVTPVIFVRPMLQPIPFYPTLNGPRGDGPAVAGAGEGAGAIAGATGCMDYTGYQSVINYSGATGGRGPITYTGPTGILGPMGRSGNMGHSGPTGPVGPMGPPGPMSPLGRHGAHTGPTGPAGPVGSALGYAWAFKANSQYVVTPLIFETLTFTETPELIGWSYNNLNGAFTCLNSGKYLVSFMVEARANSGFSTATVRGAINSIGIIGSAVTHVFFTNSLNHSWVNSFIMTIRQADIFTVEITGNNTNIVFSPSNQIASEIPVAASLTITRLV